MTEDDVVELLFDYYQRLFPKRCPSCPRVYSSLTDYVQRVIPLGSSRSYDAETRDWDTAVPVGSAAYSNCACGSTLALTTDDLDLELRHNLLLWIRDETNRRGIQPTQLLDELRLAIRERALAQVAVD